LRSSILETLGLLLIKVLIQVYNFATRSSIGAEYRYCKEGGHEHARERHTRDCLHVHTCRVLEEPQRTSAQPCHASSCARLLTSLFFTCPKEPRPGRMASSRELMRRNWPILLLKDSIELEVGGCKTSLGSRWYGLAGSPGEHALNELTVT
jgi:hypothetical protein